MNNKTLFLFLGGLIASASAFAQNNNTGQNTILGVVAGTWEIFVYDINSCHDIDLS